MPIQALGSAGVYTPPTTGTTSGELRIGEAQREGSGFAEALGAVIQEANKDQVDATKKAVDLVVNGRGSIHDAMVAVDNAEGSFRLLMEMRNRIVSGVNRLLETQL